jgi:hypothetical protein
MEHKTKTIQNLIINLKWLGKLEQLFELRLILNMISTKLDGHIFVGQCDVHVSYSGTVQYVMDWYM